VFEQVGSALFIEGANGGLAEQVADEFAERLVRRTAEA
jgi:hypothetical protein